MVFHEGSNQSKTWYINKFVDLCWCITFTFYIDYDIHNYDYPYLSMSNGARCGPRSYCINHRCVPVPEVSDYCKQCLGRNKGCDQHGRCICDKEDDCATGGRATPSPGG